MVIRIVYSFLVALVLSLSLTPLFKRIALRFNLVDKPGERKKHLLTTPLMGGMAIYLAFALVLASVLLIGDSYFFETDDTHTQASLQDTMSIESTSDGSSQNDIQKSISWQTIYILMIAGGGFMAATGLLDDKFCFSPLTKIILHTFSALAVGLAFVIKGALLDIFMTGSSIAWLAAPLTIIWLVGITNSLNLLDHADGLAAGAGAIAAVFFAIINARAGNMEIALASGVLAGATLGFLFFNYSPASIFMGDSGSNMLGFILGIIAVLGVYTYRISNLADPIREISILAPLLVLAIPIMDTVFVLLYRRNAKVSLFTADNNHIAHRLMRLGLSHREAVQVLLVIATLMGILALLLPTLVLYQAILLLAHALGISGLIFFFIKRAENKHERG